MRLTIECKDAATSAAASARDTEEFRGRADVATKSQRLDTAAAEMRQRCAVRNEKTAVVQSRPRCCTACRLWAMKTAVLSSIAKNCI